MSDGFGNADTADSCCGGIVPAGGIETAPPGPLPPPNTPDKPAAAALDAFKSPAGDADDQVRTLMTLTPIIPADELEEESENLLGSGRYGDVYYTLYKEKPVAVKRFDLTGGFATSTPPLLLSYPISRLRRRRLP